MRRVISCELVNYM